MGHEFPQKLLEAGIGFKPISTLNLQSNSIVEQVQQMIAQVWRIMIKQQKPTLEKECNELIDDGIATVMHAMRAVAHSQLDYCSPGPIVFGCDMILNIPFEVDLIMLQKKQKQKIDERLVRANAKC